VLFYGKKSRRISLLLDISVEGNLSVLTMRFKEIEKEKKKREKR
jgi:hypothetical protein